MAQQNSPSEEMALQYKVSFSEESRLLLSQVTPTDGVPEGFKTSTSKSYLPNHHQGNSDSAQSSFLSPQSRRIES